MKGQILVIGSGPDTQIISDRLKEIGYDAVHADPPTQPGVFFVDEVIDAGRSSFADIIAKLESEARMPKFPVHAIPREQPYGKRGRRQRRGGKY